VCNRGHEDSAGVLRLRIQSVVVALLPALAGALLVLLVAGPALAQQTQTPQTLGGGEIGYADWFYHLPLALGCALLVVAVDTFVILRYVRREQEA
jgi:hypothetical protein